MNRVWMQPLRAVCLVLALLMALCALAACTGGGDTPPDSSSGGGSSSSDEGSQEEPGGEFDENGFLLDHLGNRDYNDEEINILTWEDCAKDEFDMSLEDAAADALNAQVYTRNTVTEERMGVRLKFESVLGNTDHFDEYTQKALQMSQSGDVDAFACYSREANNLVTNGLLSNLLDFQGIMEFDSPWWSQELVERGTVNGGLYYCSGDISISLFGETTAVLYNKQLADAVLGEKLGDYADLYAMVEDGAWTFDAMLSLARDVGLNMDGDAAQKTALDRYGFVGEWLYYEAVYVGAGMTMLEQGEDGSVMISDDWGSSAADGLATLFADFLDTEDAYSVGHFNNHDTISKEAWLGNNALFYLTKVDTARESAEKKLSFGLLPVPKYDEEQENYYCMAGFYYTNWCIARSGKAQEATAATIECLSSEAYRRTAPTYFEKVLRLQTSDSQAEYDMWNFIKGCVTIDSGRVYDLLFNQDTWNTFRCAVNDHPRKSYITRCQEVRERMLTSVGTLNSLVDLIEGRA